MKLTLCDLNPAVTAALAEAFEGTRQLEAVDAARQMFSSWAEYMDIQRGKY